MVMASDVSCRVLMPALAGIDPFNSLPSAYLIQTRSSTSPNPGDGLTARCVAVVPPISNDGPALLSLGNDATGAVIDQAFLADLRRAWQHPLDW